VSVLAVFAGNPQMRGPPPSAHQIPNSLGHNQSRPSGEAWTSVDPRNQAQLLSLGGGPNIGGLRGAGGGFGRRVSRTDANPLLSMRQQQQQQQQHLLPT